MLVLSEEKQNGKLRMTANEIVKILHTRYEWPLDASAVPRILNPINDRKIKIWKENKTVYYEIIRDGLTEINELTQKPKELPSSASKLSEDCIKKLGPTFKEEIRELGVTMSARCPITSAMLLRKIFEKSLIKVFLALLPF